MKRIVWSNTDLNIDDWRADYSEWLEINGMDGNPADDWEVYNYMTETNDLYLTDERCNLDIQLSREIIAIADLGFWNGRAMGYKMIESGNIADCLYTSLEYSEWYVDDNGDLRFIGHHHDGTNCCVYRVFKESVTDEQVEFLQEKLYEGKATQEIIDELTDPIGFEIAKVYGWTFKESENELEAA